MESPKNVSGTKKKRLTRLTVKKTLVKLTKHVKKAKIHVINKLNKSIKMYESKRGNESQLESNRNKVQRLRSEVILVKSFSKVEVARYALQLQMKPEYILNNSNSLNDARALARLANFPYIRTIVDRFREKYPNWSSCTSRFLDKIKCENLNSSESGPSRTEKLSENIGEDGMECLENSDVDAPPTSSIVSAGSTETCATEHVDSSANTEENPSEEDSSSVQSEEYEENDVETQMNCDELESGSDAAPDSDHVSPSTGVVNDSTRSITGQDSSGNDRPMSSALVKQIDLTDFIDKDVVDIAFAANVKGECDVMSSQIKNSRKSSFFVGGKDPDTGETDKPGVKHPSGSSTVSGRTRQKSNIRGSKRGGHVHSRPSRFSRDELHTSKEHTINTDVQTAGNSTTGDSAGSMLLPSYLQERASTERGMVKNSGGWRSNARSNASKGRGTISGGKDDSEGLHPSWAARKMQKSIDLSCRGKKIVF